MTRDLMRFHARAASSEADRLAQGLAALRLVRACRLPDESDPARLAFYDEVDTLLSADQRLVYHDDLAEHEQPVYFRDFVNHAGRFGLLHLADAETGLAVRRQEPPASAAALSSLGGDLEREDYVDFIHVRRFRQSLLCHVAAAPRPVNLAEAAKQLRYYGELQFDSPDASGATRVSNPAGAGMRIDQPWALAVLKRIAAVWPDSATFADLVLGFPAEAVFELLDAAQRMSLIAVKAGTFSFAREVSTKPQVSGLARAMAARGSAVSSRAHFTIDISDAQARRVLVLADGSRDLEAIAAALRSEYPTAGVESVQQTLRRAAGFGLLAA
jgi:hypothetical protein